MAEVEYVNEANFQTEVVNSSEPVLVDVTAVWCGPCRMIDPIVKQLADEWQGKVKVVKLDADENPNVLMQFGILGIPTLMFFKGGQLAERMTGYLPKDKLVAKIAPHLN
jgi:thioredoxin 1